MQLLHQLQVSRPGPGTHHRSPAAKRNRNRFALRFKIGTVVFCRLSDITDRTGQEFAGGVRIVPVDINSNAKSDYFEQFYAGFDSFNRGVYFGKYPKSLCNSIYAASSMAPSEEQLKKLISFLLFDGQRFVAAQDSLPWRTVRVSSGGMPLYPVRKSLPQHQKRQRRPEHGSG
jgi:hypothetical protein